MCIWYMIFDHKYIMNYTSMCADDIQNHLDDKYTVCSFLRITTENQGVWSSYQDWLESR